MKRRAPIVKIEDHGLSKCGRVFITVAKFKDKKHTVIVDRSIIDRWGEGIRARQLEQEINPLGIPMDFVEVMPKRRIRTWRPRPWSAE